MDKGSLRTGFGLLLYVWFWVFIDFLLHRASWAAGHRWQRLWEVLPGAVWSGIFFGLFRLLFKLRRDARS